jgi:hypothetical protein
VSSVHFKLQTTLAPQAVLAALTDFGPSRSDVWPNIDTAHFKVHDLGAGWAEVTEGSSVAGGVWERERYSWDAAGGTVAIETLDSNTWGPGSRWDYRLMPGAHGRTAIEVTVVRNGKGWKGPPARHRPLAYGRENASLPNGARAWPDLDRGRPQVTRAISRLQGDHLSRPYWRQPIALRRHGHPNTEGCH